MQSDSQNHEMDCYDNELPDFDFSLKKHKLSDSSLQRVTPDSGIVLSYQSSVSSVGSLSPPVDKTSIDEFGKSYQSAENSEASSHGETTTVASSHSTNPVTSNVTNYPILSVASSPGQSPSHPLKSAHTIGGGQKSLMYGAPGLTSPMPATSPGVMHSSPAMMHSAIHNTAFPFNSPTAVNPTHHYPMAAGHAQSFNSYASQPMFAPAAGITSPNMYNHGRPYANGPFSNSTLPQPPSYRSYPQTPAHRSYHPSSSYPSGTNPPNMVSPCTIQKYPITPPSLSTVSKSSTSSLASQVSKANNTITSPPPLQEIVSPKLEAANHKEPADSDMATESALQVKMEDEDKTAMADHEDDQESSEQQFYTKR